MGSERRIVGCRALGLTLTVGIALAAVHCGAGLRPFPKRAPLWQDPDERAFADPPADYFSPFGWDAANHTLFRPVSRFLAVDPGGESINVNALDEVPDSSWFRNRIGQRSMSPEEVARGACDAPVLEAVGPWTVKGAKPNGANPGFIIKAADGRRYLLKFDGTLQGERATAADVLGSRLYHAIGYWSPCNSIVFFRRDVLTLDPDATTENDRGEDVPLSWRDVDEVLSKSFRLPDGRYRASASLFLPGRPLGPWTYQGTRDDDPNDVVAHEDRRELRGGYLLAAWLNHFDAREQNSLSIWIEGEGGLGHVRHYYLDFGDCLGSLWDQEGISRRLGHAYYLDIPYLVGDALTFGLRPEPWDDPHFGPTGPTLGYFEISNFDPEVWHTGYPNPAFIRATERDQAWMARILAEIDAPRLEAALSPAQVQESLTHDEIVRILLGRRQKILHRFLSRLSPLTRPEVRPLAGGAGSALCLRDAAVVGGVAMAGRRRDTATFFDGDTLAPVAQAEGHREGVEVCLPLPEPLESERYLIADIITDDVAYPKLGPLRVHLYQAAGSGQVLIAGLERPEDHEPPTR